MKLYYTATELVDQYLKRNPELADDPDICQMATAGHVSTAKGFIEWREYEAMSKERKEIEAARQVDFKRESAE